MTNKFKIIGESKPNKVRLQVTELNKVIEMPKRKVKILFDAGQLKVINPETLYQKI